MVLNALLGLFRQKPHRPRESSPLEAAGRWVFSSVPDAIYAIGDVHGCLDLLLDLEDKIAVNAQQVEGETWIVLLGDIVDRGPSSAQIIDHLMAPSASRTRRFCVRGNHEALMLDFLRRPRAKAEWLQFGGRETLLSYGVPERALRENFDDRAARNIVQSYIPDEHMEFLDALPLLIETPGAIFVHAGLRAGVPLARQVEGDLIWMRDDFAADYAEFGKVVVHGHTPRDEPLLTPHRIAIDTGAYLTGRLTAVRLLPDGPPLVLTASHNSN